MAKLIEITGKVLSGEWGTDDESGNGIPVLRTTNFTNEGIVDYSNVVTRTIQKKNIEQVCAFWTIKIYNTTNRLFITSARFLDYNIAFP